MNFLIFTVYDSAARKYLEPFFAPTIEVACRSFRQLVNREGHQFAMFPEDYTLFHIGEYDADAGVIVPGDPHSLGVALTFVDVPKSAAPGIPQLLGKSKKRR